jgi:D-tyrosyl-tRNA(Tyr) deacylase
MKVLVQRVKRASVLVGGAEKAAIGRGYLLLVGIRGDDEPPDLEWMARKVAHLRVFEDEQGKMNLDLLQAPGEILSVSQFTLYADTRRGNRPGFEAAAKPEKAREHWLHFNQLLRDQGLVVKEGIFGAHMEVELVNDGPVTIALESRPRHRGAKVW